MRTFWKLFLSRLVNFMVIYFLNNYEFNSQNFTIISRTAIVIFFLRITVVHFCLQVFSLRRLYLEWTYNCYWWVYYWPCSLNLEGNWSGCGIRTPRGYAGTSSWSTFQSAVLPPMLAAMLPYHVNYSSPIQVQYVCQSRRNSQ